MRVVPSMLVAATAVFAASVAPCSGQTAPKASAASAPPSTISPPVVVTEAAERLLKEMGAYIGSAGQFTFRTETTFDHVLPSGQKLQFNGQENVALVRPNGLYVEWGGDLGGRKLWYDGKEVTLLDSATQAYGVQPAPPTIDAMLDKVTEQLRFTPPLSDFFVGDPYKALRASVQYGFVVGESQVNGRSCTGIAVVEKLIDWQIWIETGPQIVPCKLVITYKNHPSMPQFTAIFSEWDFSPRIAPSTFTPALPAQARKIPFATAQTTVGSK